MKKLSYTIIKQKKASFYMEKTDVHLEPHYPVIPCEKPRCYLVFFMYHHGFTDGILMWYMSIIGLMHFPDIIVIQWESNTVPLN